MYFSCCSCSSFVGPIQAKDVLRSYRNSIGWWWSFFSVISADSAGLRARILLSLSTDASVEATRCGA